MVVSMFTGILKSGADPAPGRGRLKPPLPLLGPWSPSYKFAPIEAWKKGLAVKDKEISPS